MKLTPHDICDAGNKQKQEQNEQNREMNLTDGLKDETEDLKEEQDLEGYNPNWTLRKCSSKVLDQLSIMYPEQVYEILKNYLEVEMQHEDWLIKYIIFFIFK